MILIAVLILLISSLIMLVLRLTQRRASPDIVVSPESPLSEQNPPSNIAHSVSERSSYILYYWLVALTGTLTSWVLVLLSKPRQPYTLSLGNWRPVIYFPDSPKILVDSLSWPFALALATLVLVVILTVPIRLQGVNWHAWASSLALAGFGLLAVLAGNLLTLMLAWAALDFLEIAILLVHVKESRLLIQALITLTSRVGGIGLLLWAYVTAGPAGSAGFYMGGASTPEVPASLSLILLIAAGLRLGVLPLHLPFIQEPPLRRGLGTSLRLVPATASLVLLARTATAGIPASWFIYLLILAGLSSLYGAILWITAPDELGGRPYWILCITSFAVASAVCGLPGASQAWGLACVFSGGLLFLFSSRHRYFSPLLLLGLLGFIGLPFTPTWGGMLFYSSHALRFLWPLYIIAQALLIAGYIRHSLRSEPLPEQSQRWVWVLYPIGLILLPAVQFTWFWQVLGSQGNQIPIIPLNINHLPVLMWIIGFLSLALAVLLLWINSKRWIKPSYQLLSISQQVFSLGWFYRFLALSLRFSIRVVSLLTGVVEGDGGILWVLVLLSLLVALLLSGRRLL